MITLISDPSYSDSVSPPNISRWLATESPNNLRLLRRDWICSGADSGGFLELTTTINYTGAVTNSIAAYCVATNQMYIGKVTNVDGTLKIVTTDITWVVGMNIIYFNDNTLHGGYYFEGRLTINSIVESLTIIASPDSFGYADLDISGLLRIKTSISKTGDYTDLIMKEPTKSGNFTLEYRECWYGSNESYTDEGNIWYYAEAVRSEEQGSNLHEYVPNDIFDAPFFNLFAQPVYFVGLPFDISFILPETAITSPAAEITVTVKKYSSLNLLLDTDTTIVPIDSLDGFVNSLNIDPVTIEDQAAYMTAEITI